MPKTKKVKAETRTWEFRNAYGHYCGEEPVWTLPRTAAAYDKMVEQMAKAMFVGEAEPGYEPAKWAETSDRIREHYRKLGRAALRAIDITRPKDGK